MPLGIAGVKNHVGCSPIKMLRELGSNRSCAKAHRDTNIRIHTNLRMDTNKIGAWTV